MRWLAKIVLGRAAFAVAMLAFFAPGAAQEPPVVGSAVLLDVNGAIGPATSEYLRQGFEAASERGARLIILRMDTPGGLETAMRDIVRAILASPIPVVTYVSPSGARAASAGTYILYASHLAAMAPGTNLGAATPVQLGDAWDPRGAADGKERQSENRKGSGDKAVNDAAALIRGLAELHRRNPEWAETAVREAASLSATEALEKGVVEIVASDVDDLMRKANGRIVRVRQAMMPLDTAALTIVSIEPNWRTRLLAVITNPNIAFMLMLVGLYGLLFEFMNPGTVVPGTIGSISLLVGLFALNLLPVNYAGAGLILLGVALLLVEAFTPTHGVLGVGGMAAFGLGSILLFPGDMPGFSLSPAVIVTATGVCAALALLAGSAAIRSYTRPIVTGNATIVGRPAEVLSWSGNEGEVRVHGERWRARAAAPLLPGQRVRIVARDGLTVVVEPEPQASS